MATLLSIVVVLPLAFVVPLQQHQHVSVPWPQHVRATAPVMGVPGFVAWLETFPEALVDIEIDADGPSRAADVVAFDLNSLVHNALRNSKNEDQAIKKVFQMLHSTLKQVRPHSTVLLALDGAAPLAKMETQRKRRAKSSGKSKRQGVSGLCATPGTRFMADMEQALVYWCCSELSACA